MVAIESLHRALLEPTRWFKSLTDATLVEGGTLHRTTHFAEAMISWQGKRWLLSLPLSAAALALAQGVERDLMRLSREWLHEYSVLYDELKYIDSLGVLHSAHLLLERLPEGCPLSECATMISSSRLIEAIDLLEVEFAEAEFSHNNLKFSNLYLDTSGRLHPVRLHYSDDKAGDDFEPLRREVTERFVAGELVGLEPLRYDHTTKYMGGHLYEGRVHEGMILVRDQAGYGFVDPLNRTLIPSQYEWASDMQEGRAVVRTLRGMALIDRYGEFIIPDEYEIVDYLPDISLVKVRREGLWALYNYVGEQVVPFTESIEELDLYIGDRCKAAEF